MVNKYNASTGSRPLVNGQPRTKSLGKLGSLTGMLKSRCGLGLAIDGLGLGLGLGLELLVSVSLKSLLFDQELATDREIWLSWIQLDCNAT
jgi:hypothetical protein